MAFLLTKSKKAVSLIGPVWVRPPIMIKVDEFKVTMQCDWTALGNMTNFCHVLEFSPEFEMKSELKSLLKKVSFKIRAQRFCFVFENDKTSFVFDLLLRPPATSSPSGMDEFATGYAVTLAWDLDSVKFAT
jgi:hypothetical protein